MIPVEPSIHRVDRMDRVCFVNETWLAFAQDNAVRGLTRETVLGRPIWSYIAGDDASYLFRALLAEVRDRQRVIRVPFRCDAPALRRDMELEMLPLPAGAIEFRSHLVVPVPREPLALLDATLPRAAWGIRICTWCKGVEVSAGAWEETDIAARALGLFARATLPRLTHTVCPRCAAAIRARLSPDGGDGRV